VAIEGVGVIGVGEAGAAVARRLLAQGREVTVHDRDPWKVVHLAAEGARPARIPADAAEPADVVFVLVSGETAAEEVLFDCGGVGETLRDGGFVVLMSRTGAEFARSAAARLGRFGIGVVEASAVDGIGRAPGTLLVGCDADDLSVLTPVLRAIAEHVVRAGAVGAVATMRQLMTSLPAPALTVPVGAGAAGTGAR
jgi:3-hydroxyisobutyrate dehydrogenase-like beta-hydroxyacid dehydrogenase